MNDNIAGYLYLIAGVLFILALRGLSNPKTAVKGNIFGMSGMAIAIITTLLLPSVESVVLPLALLLAGGLLGAIIAWKINMTSLPQLIAIFHSFVGLAAVFVGLSAFYAPEVMGILSNVSEGIINPVSRFELSLGSVIGGITFSGSMIAFGKLQGIAGSNPLLFRAQHFINLGIAVFIIFLIVLFSFWQSSSILLLAIALSIILGVLLILPIGGADMPVVVSMLNSYSGWAACGIGFTLANPGLIITGALVGSSGAILSYIMCKGMNRSILSVILGGFGTTTDSSDVNKSEDNRPVKSGSAVDAAFLLQNAESIIVIPGYGLAVAQAQFVLQELYTILKEANIKIRFAIHPVAGRMPGHMNVLLAEAGIPYEDVLELDEVNRDFANAQVALIIGANDITNPAAKTDKTSPIYGMPVFDAHLADRVLFVKRSMGSGYAGISNPLFFDPKTLMLFGDAKNMCENIIKAMEK